MKLFAVVALSLFSSTIAHAEMGKMQMNSTTIDVQSAPDIAFPPRVIGGLGDSGYDVERATPAAHAEFENGVRLNNGFNEGEAIRAFGAAERLDPNCALCFWGEAAARAPTINYDISADEAAVAVAKLDKAEALSADLSPKGHEIIAAERKRYVQRDGAWAVDNAAEAEAAETLANRFPLDDTLQVAAANAWLIAAGTNGPGSVKPDSPDLPRAQAKLDTVLARSPNFTPAMHLYLHLMEWEHHLDRADPYARRLGHLAPEAGHMLHMASHIYYHEGRYEAAALANTQAAKADADYVTKVRPPGGMDALPMHQHNLDFGLGSALLSGDAPLAMKFAREMQANYPPTRMVFVRAYLAFGRVLPVSKVLGLAAPKQPLAAAFYHNARGEALARKGDALGVLAEAQGIGDLQHAADFGKQDPRVVAMLEVPRLELVGRAAMLRRDWPAAINAYRAAAVFAEDNDPFADPPLWPWSPRRSLAEALLKNGDAAAARTEAEAALKTRPNDGVTLHVLADAAARLGNPDAARIRIAAKRAWKGSAALLRPPLI